MFSEFDNFTQQQHKGLFTFYREQAQHDEEIKRIKKERRLNKMKQADEKRQREELEEAEKVLREGKEREEGSKTEMKVDKEQQRERVRKSLLYQPKNRREKYTKQQIGNSVIIVNSKQITNSINPNAAPSDLRNQHSSRSIDQRTQLRRIQQLINPSNNNRYFLQNKQLPVNFGKLSIQKQIVKGQEDHENGKNKEKIKNRKDVVKQSYFNNCTNQQNDKKCIPTFSYDHLPQLIRKSPPSQLLLPKRYKSKKVQTALRSNNSQLIRQIRQSLREQSIVSRAREQVSILQVNAMQCPEVVSYEIEYENRLNSKLDAKQKRLIQILRAGGARRKRNF